MSSLIVEVVRIDEVRPHPDPAAERIAVAVIKGWRTVVPKVDDGTGNLVPKYSVGDEVIYVPPDAMLPPEVAEHWGVAKYLGQDGRVKSAKMRGQMSYGFIADVEPICGEGFIRSQQMAAMDPGWVTTFWVPEVGDDVADYYSIVKWEPGENFNSAELEPENPAFRRYTEIELFENFPEKISVGTEVVITEKIHGTNSRVGLIRSPQEGAEPFFVCGTHESQVRQDVQSHYLVPLRMESVQRLLRKLYDETPGTQAVVIFGEVYGYVQSLHYGHQKGCVSFRAFDVSIDGNFIDWDRTVAACSAAGVEMVPVLYRGPFDPDRLMELSDGPTTVGGDHIREGVVCHPVVEAMDEFGERVIVKRISPQYRLKQDKISDSH